MLMVGLFQVKTFAETPPTELPSGIQWNLAGRVESNFSRVVYVPGKTQSPTDPGNYTPYVIDFSKNAVPARANISIQTEFSAGKVLAGSDEMYGTAIAPGGSGWSDQFTDIPDQQRVVGKEGEALVSGIICVSVVEQGSPGYPFAPWAGVVVLKAKARVHYNRVITLIGGLPEMFKWWEINGSVTDDYEMRVLLNGRCPLAQGNANNVYAEKFAKMTIDEMVDFVKQL
jgi:hypothetical protein